MNQPCSLVLSAFVLFGIGGVARGSETAVHNDFDGDGRSDLLWRNQTSGAMVYWPSADYGQKVSVRINAPANFSLSQMSVAGTGNYYDNAARTNILLREAVTNNHFLLVHDYAQGSGYVSTLSDLSFDVDADSQVVATGDFNNGTLSDILVRNQRTGGNSVVWGESWEYNFSPISSVTNLAWEIMGVGDFDGDGGSDILWRNAATGDNLIWRSALAQFPLRVVRVSNLAWKITAVGDFDGDGRSDIFWRNTSTGANVIWKSGSHATRQAVVGVTNQSWQVAAVGDFDGDGRADLFWRNASTGRNVIWKSANAYTQQAVVRVGNLDWSVIR
jgi:hypothetical protein